MAKVGVTVTGELSQEVAEEESGKRGCSGVSVPKLQRSSDALLILTVTR